MAIRRSLESEPSQQRRLTAQFETSRALAESSSFAHSIPRVLHAICEGMDWEVGVYWTLDRGQSALRCERVLREPAALAGEFEALTLQSTFARGAGLPGRVWESGAPVAVEDFAREPGFARATAAAREGLRGAYAHPVFAAGELAGVMEFFSKGPCRADDDLFETMEAIATQLGRHIDRMRAEEACFLSEASAMLAASLDMPTTLSRVAHLAVPFLADWCAIDVVDRGGFRRVAVAHVDPSLEETAHELQRRFPPDPDLPYGYPKVLRTSESEYWPEVADAMLEANAKDPDHLRLLRRLGFRSYMCVPLLAHGRTLGVVSFVISDPGRRRFRPSDLGIAEEIGRRAGLATDNARLYQEAENARRRADLLAEVSRLLAFTQDYRHALGEVARLSVPELGDCCSIHVYEDDGTEGAHEVAHVERPLEDTLREMSRRYPRHAQGGIARVMQSGEPILVSHATDEMLVANAIDADHLELMRRFSPRSYMIVPIAAHGRILGVISFVSRTSGRFSEADITLAVDLGSRVALAVSNTRLILQATEALRARDEFLSVASHELKTPLTALHLLVGSLRTVPAETVQQAVAAKLEIAERQVGRITGLVNKLFDLSRISAGRMDLDVEDVDLGATSSDVIERFRGELERLGCAISLEAPAAPVIGRWDRFRIEQVVTNLLSNAMKYGSGKPIVVRVEGTRTHARLSVADQGTGIHKTHLDRIFQRFTRGTAVRKYDGLGLGLYIVRQIMDALGGKIDVISEPGRGSMFTVEMPLIPPRPRD